MGKTANGGTNLGAVIPEVYDLLAHLDAAERARVIGAVMQLFGDSVPPITTPITRPAVGGTPDAGHPSAPHDGQSMTPQEFFIDKAPQNKGEMLAVAARYRELHAIGDSHRVDDIAAFFQEARQNFDRHNFARDIKNAQHQAKFFNIGTPRGEYRLSYYGQQYVDALPDRDVLKKLKRPAGKKKSSKRKSRKKVSAK